MSPKPLDFRKTTAMIPSNKRYPLERPLDDNTIVQNVFTVTQANSYDDKIMQKRHIPTGAELQRDKLFVTVQEYTDNINEQKNKKALTLAYIHEFLFDLAYVPFIKIPLRDYNGRRLYDVLPLPSSLKYTKLS